jgi:hypothetical protein
MNTMEYLERVGLEAMDGNAPRTYRKDGNRDLWRAINKGLQFAFWDVGDAAPRRLIVSRAVSFVSVGLGDRGRKGVPRLLRKTGLTVLVVRELDKMGY